MIYQRSETNQSFHFQAYQQQANPNDVDIYNKLVHLQEELRRLQEAEQLLSNALSNRYIELTQQENTQK